MDEASIPTPLALPSPRVPPLTKLPATVDLSGLEFVTPVKKIKTPQEMALWETSEAYRDINGFILAMNNAIKGRARSDAKASSEMITKLMTVLETLEKWVGEIPAAEQPSRFGNKAYKDWHARLDERCDELLRTCLSPDTHAAIVELRVYLLDSFGNAIRIDYGTGHELAFVTFLCCLFKIGFLTEEDSINVVFRVFQKYLELCRALQLTYRMEPAGSHGAWSLDDFQFMGFLWGAAQLINNSKIEPKTAVIDEVYSRFATDYLFLDGIQHVNRVKTGPFHEHSNQLWNISGVPMWSKVNSGLIKMYKVEVLAKFPIIQHYFFGSLMSIKTTA